MCVMLVQEGARRWARCVEFRALARETCIQAVVCCILRLLYYGVAVFTVPPALVELVMHPPAYTTASTPLKGADMQM